MRLSSPGVHRLRRRLGALGLLAARQFLRQNVNLSEQVVSVLLPWLHRLERIGKRALRRPYGEFGYGFSGGRLQCDISAEFVVWRPYLQTL